MGATDRTPPRQLAPSVQESESDSDDDDSDAHRAGDDDDDHALVSAHFAATHISSRPAIVPGNAPEQIENTYAYQGDALVGATVSILDTWDERQNAKVIMYCGNGQYMVRTNSMQFAEELGVALRRRECWIVAKPPSCGSS